MSSPVYDERLRVPLRWWVQGTMLVATFWLAMIVALPGALAWAVTAILSALAVSLFLGYGGARVRLHDGVLQAGRARIETRFLGDVQPLDREHTRRLTGVDADARAYLLLRPYLSRAVRVEIVDPRDPTPYWLLSTRDPGRLAAALREVSAPAGPVRLDAPKSQED